MAFRGKRVMLSRTLVPPDMFDMLHGILKENGAEVCLCSNPEFNSSSDFHVLLSCESEKFAELQARGCKVVGPECVMRCAKERRGFPPAPYTCCLTFDGLRILSTGFEGAEKTRVHQLVIAMCGEFCAKPSMDVNFVIAKDVLTPKYKWAAFTLRKPILSIHWLLHCFRDHRRVPHETYRLPIFTGVKVCTTGILMEQRNKIAQLVKENGGTLRADLTRECTHLIAKSAESDKFKVANMHWRHIKCVNEDWFWNSLAEKVCLEETSYAVQGGGSSSGPKVYQAISGLPPSQDNLSQDALTSATFPAPAIGSSIPEADAQGLQGGDLTVFGEGNDMYLSGCRIFLTGFELAEMRRLVRMVLSGGGTRYVEFNDRVTHVVLGKPSERQCATAFWNSMITRLELDQTKRTIWHDELMSKTMNIWRGEAMYHNFVCFLLPSEFKDIRQYALWGTVEIVMPTWLEECARQKRELAVTAQFIVPQALLSNDSYWKQGRNKTVPVEEKKLVAESGGARVLQKSLWDASEAQTDAGADFKVSQDRGVLQQPLNTLASKPDSHPRQNIHNSKPSSQVPQKQVPAFVDPVTGAANLAQEPMRHTLASIAACEDTRCEPNSASVSHPTFEAKEGVFKGHIFGFAPSFETFKRAEVVQWVLEGGGVMLGEVGSGESLEAEFMICPHGSKTDLGLNQVIKSMTTQWIRCCLEEGMLLDTNRHILFQPLRCEVPLPGFQTLRFAVTQYPESERKLLYNLCHVLGAKYQEKMMNRKATHLLCKVGDGDKYEAALQWGVEIVTADWLYACVAQNMVVIPDPYRPKKLTAADKDAGLAIPTQNPIQLTFRDTRVPFTERCSVENNVELPLPAKVNEVVRVEAKGKTATTKKKASLRGRMQVLQGNKPSRDCYLTSQSGGDLDPWDELTASWDKEYAIRGRTTRSIKKAGTSPRVLSSVPVNLGLGERRSELPADLKQCDIPTGGSQGNENRTQFQTSAEHSLEPMGFDNQEDDSGGDVAAAIEGLLAQTSKVRSEDDSRSPNGDQDLLSHEPIKLRRRNGEGMRERANFKRPKLVADRYDTRSVDSGGEQPVQSAPAAEDSFEKFEESQMDSQVVAYDEDHSEKQRIMERVRTRSMSTTTSSGSGGSVQRKNMTWKATEFKRLLKAADANK